MTKYELNTPYDFEVNKVVDNNGSLTFEVEIGGNLFPVKAYPEQIEEVTPKTLSCRIMLDKNKNAYLVQNEAFLYPTLYKLDHRYIFEVVDIRDSHAVLQDKHGLCHAMDKDGTSLSYNEIIVRCVEIVYDNNYKAHLRFTYTEPDIEEKKEDKTIIIPQVPVSPVYAPTEFEEDAPKSQVTQKKKLSSNLSEDVLHSADNQTETDELTNYNASVSSLLMTKDWYGLKTYLDKNLIKAKIDPILKEIASTIEKYSLASQYWETVRFLIKYDAQTFLGTIAKVDTSRIIGISENVDPKVLNDIIIDAFMVTDKLKHSLDILRKCSTHLTIKQKNYIQSKCIDLNTSDAFYNLFKLLGLSPDDAVIYLLSLKDNIAAAYTLYKFYSDGKNGNKISEGSKYHSFCPSKIAEYIQFMEKMQSYPFKVAANLINSIILSREYCPADLRREVVENGYGGFLTYVTRKQQQKASNENIRLLAELAVGDILNELNYLEETDYYYILRKQELGAYALLDKNLTKVIPNHSIKINAKIARVMTHNKRKVFIVTQKTLPSMYSFPPLVDNSTLFDIAFSEKNNNRWAPLVKKYYRLINIEVESLPRSFDNKSKYQAKIVKRKDFFTYIVRVIENNKELE